MNPQGGSGSFMSNASGNQNGQGSALMQLLRLKAMGVNSGVLNQNSQNPQAVLPSNSPASGNPMPQGGLQQQQPSQPPTQPQQAPQMPMQAQPIQAPPPSTPDSNLELSLQALGNYIKAHGEAHMAKNGVHSEKARAQMITRQNQTQGGQ